MMENESRTPAFNSMRDGKGPLFTKPLLAGTTASRHRPTPPATPPSSCSPYHSASEGAEEIVSPHTLGKGIAAPATAVDDIAEKFGRTRAHSLSRHDLSLPAWKEDDEDEGALPEEGTEPSLLDIRRRAVSMSMAEEYRRKRPNRQALALLKQCLDCHLPPSFAHEGEPAIFCRAHQMEGMVDVLREGCTRPGCNRTAAYGFPEEGRQRCFSHMEEGMVHVLSAMKAKEK